MVRQFSVLYIVQIGPGAHPTFYRKITWLFSLIGKRLGNEAYLSHPTSAEVMNNWTIHFPYALMA
jgi:hypothetical protein